MILIAFEIFECTHLNIIQIYNLKIFIYLIYILMKIEKMI